MLIEGHIFTIKTKDPQNVADIKNVSTDVVISGLNVLKDQIAVGDLVFVVFGGDKPSWKTGLVGLAQISRAPFDEGYDGKKNFRVGIDIVSFFEHITRGDLVSYPDTFDTIGIAPITKWEPNQAITSVPKEKAIALLQAVCELRSNIKKDVEKLLGTKFAQLTVPVKRYIETLKPFCGIVNLREEFRAWLTNVYRKKDGSALGDTSSYVNCLSYLTDASQYLGKYDERSTSYWYNMYHFLYGEDGASVFECLTRNDVEKRFKGVIAAVIDGDAPDGVDIAHFNIVREWSNEPQVKKGSWVKCSFARYFEFLEWRETQKKSEDKKDELPPNVDRLSVALKLFAEKRFIDKPGGVWESYDAWTKSVRSEFVSVDESLLSNSAFNYLEYIRKYTVSGFVANTSFARHSSDEKCEVLKFLKSQKDSPKSASWYIDVANRLVVGGNQVDGMTPKSLLYFMSELHPEEFAAWTEPTYEQLEFLGLHKGAAPSDLTIETYEDCKAKQQLIVAKMKELKIGKASDDSSAPDYRTANEFLWWLGQDDNKNLIKEKVMSKAMKKDKFKKYEGEKELDLNSSSKDDELLLRLLASLRAKPFAILAGHSGTGKSRYVKKLAYMTCNAEELRNDNQLPGNYLLLQVKPNWHDSTDLLGFRNAMVGGAYQKTELIKFLFKAYHFSETPFFLCLDEMNLAPVEQYFAEFLSAMESKEPVPLNDISEKDDNLLELGCEWEDSLEYLKNNGFSIPNNLFIVGTVNMDETTNQFSRKVLDRAFTIEMTDVDFTNYGNVTEPSYGDTLKPAIIESLLNGEKAVSALDEEDKKADSSLVKVQKALASTPFAIAYRFANEYTLLKRAIKCFDVGNEMKLDALDQAVLMKILPRIAGERDYIEKVYGEKENEGLRGALEGKQVSLKKIEEILKRAKDTNSQYITFWP